MPPPAHGACCSGFDGGRSSSRWRQQPFCCLLSGFGGAVRALAGHRGDGLKGHTGDTDSEARRREGRCKFLLSFTSVIKVWLPNPLFNLRRWRWRPVCDATAVFPGVGFPSGNVPGEIDDDRRRHQCNEEDEHGRLMALDQLVWLLPPMCTVLASGTGYFQVPLHDDVSNKEYHKWLTGTVAAVICYLYIFLKMYEVEANVLPILAFKSWISWSPEVRVFRDTAVLVVLSYVLLLNINLSFVWLAIFPAIAIAFICVLYFKLYRGTGGKITPRSSNDDDKTISIPVELELIVMTTFLALIVINKLPEDAAKEFPISQFLLFVSFTVAALRRMVMKLPADAYRGIAPATELLHKTLLLLLLVRVHTVAAEWLGEDVVLVCMPEVVPLLLWFSLHLDRVPGSRSIISVEKTKAHRNCLVVFGAVVVAPLLAYRWSSYGVSWCTTIMISCGVSGILTYYLGFMQRHWSCPRQQAAAGSTKHDVPSSGMLKLWADALLIVAAALLLLRYLVSSGLVHNH